MPTVGFGKFPLTEQLKLLTTFDCTMSCRHCTVHNKQLYNVMEQIQQAGVTLNTEKREVLARLTFIPWTCGKHASRASQSTSKQLQRYNCE